MFGKLTRKRNQKSKLGSSLIYNSVCVLNELGKFETLLLTDSELRRIRNRAELNPEDLVRVSWLKKAFIYTLGILFLL